MKAVKEVNGTFDLDCLSYKKESTMKFFSKLCKLFNKKKEKKKKRTPFLILQCLLFEL